MMKKLNRYFRYALILGMLIILTPIGYVGWLYIEAPDFNQLQSSVQVPILTSKKSPATKTVGPDSPFWVPLEEISSSLVYAVVATEDTTFFTHQGIDFFEITEAIKTDIEHGRFARGASTISQQLIKNLYLTHQKTLQRKFKEAIWTTLLEKELSKTEILTFYLNVIEWGPGIYGIGEASEHYFGIPPSDLSIKQSAFLALLIPSPKKYYQYFRDKKLTEWAQKRLNQILETMRNLDFISASALSEAKGELLW